MADQTSEGCTVMVHFNCKAFSEEVCRPVSYAAAGGKDHLRDAIMLEFSDILPRSVKREDIMLAVRYYIKLFIEDQIVD